MQTNPHNIRDETACINKYAPVRKLSLKLKLRKYLLLFFVLNMEIVLDFEICLLIENEEYEWMEHGNSKLLFAPTFYS